MDEHVVEIYRCNLHRRSRFVSKLIWISSSPWLHGEAALQDILKQIEDKVAFIF